MKQKTSPWMRIRRRNSEVYVPVRKKKSIIPTAVCIALVLAVVVVMTLLRIPERIGMIQSSPTEDVTPSPELTGKYKALLAEILEMEYDADWDGDGLKNGADPHPRNIDANKDGVPDGSNSGAGFYENFPATYGNMKLIVQHDNCGFVEFRGRYYFRSFTGWVGFSDTEGIPYLNTKGEWKRADYEKRSDLCYVYIPGDCIVVFTDSGKPRDIAVEVDIVKADCTVPPDERYAVANAPLSQLEEIYVSIDNGKTKQISILTDNGEQLLTVYGYDGDGNLFVAGVDSGKPMGKISITIQAMIFYDTGEWSMRSWFEFSWGELSSEAGCIITVF